MNFGIRNKLGHFLHKLRQILLVGVTLGMMRTVVPALAESEFGVPRGSSTVLVTFMVAFGFIKCTMNFCYGQPRRAHRL